MALAHLGLVLNHAILPAGRAAPSPLPAAEPPAVTEVWHSRYGPIVIQARGDEVWVDGQRVEPAFPAELPDR